MTIAPTFFALTPAECTELLERNHVGRLAFRSGERVDIEPLGYVASGEWIFLRSAYGAKLDAIMKDPFVALEIDEIDGPFDWRSVVVHGTIYMLDAEGGPVEQREAGRALAAIRSAMPGAFTPADPVPERAYLYGLHIQETTGRMASSELVASSAKRNRIIPRSPPAGRRPADTF